MLTTQAETADIEVPGVTLDVLVLAFPAVKGLECSAKSFLWLAALQHVSSASPRLWAPLLSLELSPSPRIPPIGDVNISVDNKPHKDEIYAWSEVFQAVSFGFPRGEVSKTGGWFGKCMSCYIVTSPPLMKSRTQPLLGYCLNAQHSRLQGR